MGLLVRVGDASTITVDPGQGVQIRVGWGRPEPPAERFGVPSCPGDSEWNVYAGGVWVSDVACFALTVEADGRRQGIVLPIGSDCP